MLIKCYQMLLHGYHILSHAYHMLITCCHMLPHPITSCHIQLRYTLTPMLSHSYSSMLSDNCTMQKYVHRDESKLLHESGTLKADYKNEC